MSERGFYLRVTDPAAHDLLTPILGERVPILAPFPLPHRLPDRMALAYYLDHEQLTPSLQAAVVEVLHRRF